MTRTTPKTPDRTKRRAPVVSVIMPAYNAEKYIKKTLISVLNQTFTDFEIVVVDDGSTDNTAKIAQSLNDPRIRIISQKNGGTPSARNTGIRHALGTYVAFLDADDLWLPEKLQHEVTLLDTYPDIDALLTWVDIIDKEGKPLRKGIHPQNRDVLRSILLHSIHECGSNGIIRSSLLPVTGVFDVTLLYCADRDFWLRVSSRFTVCVIEEVLVLYRKRPGAISSNWHQMTDESITVSQKHKERLPQGLLRQRTRTAYSDALCYAISVDLSRREWRWTPYYLNRFAKSEHSLFLAILIAAPAITLAAMKRVLRRFSKTANVG